jgi:hypothetical protein
MTGCFAKAPVVGHACPTFPEGLSTTHVRGREALSVAEAAVLWFMPETATPQPGALASLLPHVHVPRIARATSAAVSPGAIWTMRYGKPLEFPTGRPTVHETVFHRGMSIMYF